MIKFKFIAFSIASSFFLHSCSNILEPVSLFDSKSSFENKIGQEEFEIIIENLTFETARKSNNAQYSRQLILTGSGSRANVFDEADFLKSNFPIFSGGRDYLLGKGDKISFVLMNEFENKTPQWPVSSEFSDYLLGVGDALTFTQSNDNGAQSIPGNREALISTEGVIGSNGNILLFGLGNIQAKNRTLDDVRTDVRNILIRNGLAPNFQLEISDFQSQKVYITKNNTSSPVVNLNNNPLSLKQLVIINGISEADRNLALIKLTRDGKIFTFSAKQLFNLDAPKIILQNNDLIAIEVLSDEKTIVKTTVGSKGNILLPSIGSISAVDRTLDSLHQEISRILSSKGMKPTFQLELGEFISKKIYLVQNELSRKVIPLTNSNTTLRQLLFENNSPNGDGDSLSVVKLKRNGQTFQMTREQILDPKAPNIWLTDKDHIEIEDLIYKPGQVFALSGAGNAKMVPINPSTRETLADILFVPNGALNNLLAKRSEVYLLRGQNPSVAYHLDAQNVSRILVAAQTELRPNDIIYVAERPIISFSRTLSEILPLRILLRDIKNNKIP
ncbi:polysaccharide biosynthesis/export family protein [Amylibacter sp.]|nr:polysaccharide biosynthesis/export family protein [Amylibacter sp.]